MKTDWSGSQFSCSLRSHDLDATSSAPTKGPPKSYVTKTKFRNMATNEELLVSKLFNVEGLVAVVTGALSPSIANLRWRDRYWIEYYSLHLTK
jgi:hypothetical protein